MYREHKLSDIWQAPLTRFIPPDLEKADSLLFWRTKILAAMLLFGSVVGVASLVPVFFLALEEGVWLLFWADLLMFSITVGLLLGRDLDFRIRAGLTMAMLYLVGVVVIATAGIFSGGAAWIFAFAVLTGVLLGYKGAFLALGINSLTMSAIGYMLYHNGWWGVTQVTYYPPEILVTGVVSFIFMNGAASLSISVLLKGLTVTHDEQIRLATSLKEKQRRLAGEIRDRRQANRARVESEERYRIILDSIEDGYFEVDLEGRITFFNGSLSRLLGVPENQLAGMNPRTLMDGANAGKITRVFRHAYDTGEASQLLDCQLIRKDGSICHIEMVVSLILSRHKAIVGFRGIARDVSARIALEKRLVQSSKMESIGTLAAGIAHDFNNVLYIIVGNADLALDSLPQGGEAYHNLTQIKTASLRAADIVKQLLSFSREREQNLEALDLVRLINEELEFMRSTFPSSVEIEAQLCPEPVPVLGDKVQLKQLMINLFTNAVQAVEGSAARIHLVLSLLPPGRLPLSEQPPRPDLGAACLVVQDNGPGIEEKNLDRVFDPYFTTKEVGKGSGMGLSVVHSIVKNHSGRIEATSPVGEGARFEVLLPLTDRRPPTQAPEDRFKEISLYRGREKILLVDDETLIVDTNTRALKRLGYNVTGVCSPDDAWEIFCSDPRWDLVITDMTMPGMTGDILTGKIHEFNPNIPVIICTGYADFVAGTPGQTEGPIAVLHKPVPLDLLAEKVRMMLDGCPRLS